MNILLKNRKYTLSAMVLVIALCGTGFFSSCSEEFLKPEPLSFYEPGVTFTTETGLQLVMAGADRKLRGYWTHREQPSNALPMGWEYMCSDLKAYGKTDVNANDPMVVLATGLTPTSGLGNGDGNGSDGGYAMFFWRDTYLHIREANTIIQYVDGVGGLSETLKNAYLGRAYFHRAFCYYNLVFQFGDVPFVTKLLDVPKMNYRSTKKEAILEKITEDLEFAIQFVPDQKDMTLKGMVNKATCRMLIAKCYLALGQYQKAKEQMDILIDQSGYSLMQNSFGTFVQGGEPRTWPITRNLIWDLHRSENKLHASNTEVIMAMPNRGVGAESFRNFQSMRIFGPMWSSADNFTLDGSRAMENYARSNANYDVNYDYLRAIGRGIATFRPTYFAQRTLWVVNGVEDEEDLRHNSASGNWVKMTNLKYNRPGVYKGQNLTLRHPETGALLTRDSIRCWFDYPHYKLWYLDVGAEASQTADQFNGATAGSTGGHADLYLYRLAEAYLIRAEAKFYLGDIAGATADVNKIRERAKCSQLYSTVNIGDIVNERARELYLEEWRNVELTRVSLCLAMSGKPDEWGNTYNLDTWNKQAGTDPAGGSYWWQRICHYNEIYNSGPINANSRVYSYTIGKHNLYWPIPNRAIVDNSQGSLFQNYGYDGYNKDIPVWSTWQEAIADEDKTE